MAIVTIPTDTTKLFWDQTTTLDGVPYLLTFRYNSRESVYYLQIASADGSTVYAQGIKLVSNFPLLQMYSTPPGELFAISTSSTDDSPATLGELGDDQRVSLLYIEEATLFSAGAAASGESWRFPGVIV